MGKIVGAILGYVIFHKLIAVVAGAIIGYLLWDRRTQSPQISRENLAQIQTVFFKTVFTLLGHIAKADGHISENEIKVTESYMDKMGLTPEHRQEAIRLFKFGSSLEFNLQQQLSEFVGIARRSPNLSQMLLVYLVNIAMADGAMDSTEAKILREVAASLGFSPVAFEQLLQMIGAQNTFGGGQQTRTNDIDLAYKALGVNKESSDSDIKKAYRKLMSQYHPDKLIGQGLPDDMIKAATERSQEIQAAYDLIKKARGQ